MLERNYILMKEKDLISIIIPVYNGENYIKKCIKSVLEQTYSDIEVIIIDDGSSDNTKKVCTSFLDDNRVRYYYQDNAGLSSARNKGIKMAHGKWIMFVDSDDWVSPYFCEFSVASVKKTNAELGLFKYTVVRSDTPNELNQDINKVTKIRPITETEALALIIDDNKVGNYAWNKIYKYSLFDNLKFPVNKKFEDLGLMYKIIDHARNYVYVDKSLYFYVQRNDSLMHSLNEQDIIDAFDFRYLQFEFLEKKFPSLVYKALPAMIINSLQLIYKTNSSEFEVDRKKAIGIIKKYPISSKIKLRYKILSIITRTFL